MRAVLLIACTGGYGNPYNLLLENQNSFSVAKAPHMGSPSS